jgi:hypothetical protein
MASIRRKEEVRLPSKARRQSNRAFYQIRPPGDGYKPASKVLHHQLQERPTEIHRLLQHQIGAISAIELDLLLDDG